MPEAGSVGRRWGGVFVYVSCQGKPRQAQIQARRAQPPPTPPPVELPDPDRIIAVLVELIQRPQIQPKALATRLRRRGVAVTPRHIQAILTRYDLAGKRGRRTR